MSEIAIGVAGLVMALLAAFLAYRQNRAGQRLAMRELASNLALDVRINGGPAEQIVWIVPDHPSADHYITDLEIELFNKGTKTIDDVRVLIDAPNSMYLPGFPRSERSDSSIIDFSRSECSDLNDRRTRVTYKISSIHRGVRLNLTDIISIPSNSRLKSTVHVTTKDGIEGAVTWGAVFGYRMQVFVLAKDIPPISFEFDTLTFQKSDDALRYLYDETAARDALISAVREGKEARSAQLLFVTPTPIDAPPEVAGQLARVSASGAQVGQATYYPDVGYLPFDKVPE